jgi:hypothetical protein
MRVLRPIAAAVVLALVAAVVILYVQLGHQRDDQRARSDRLDARLTALAGAADNTPDVGNLARQLTATRTDVDALKKAVAALCDDKRVSVEEATLGGASSAQTTYTRYYNDLIEVIDTVCGLHPLQGAAGG